MSVIDLSAKRPSILHNTHWTRTPMGGDLAPVHMPPIFLGRFVPEYDPTQEVIDATALARSAVKAHRERVTVSVFARYKQGK